MSEERRVVTVLFADAVGSTSLGDSLDPEDLRRLLGRFYDIAKEVVADHDGTLEKFIGDAAMAIFGLPQAHDDDARRALDAALDLRDGIRSDAVLGDRLPIRIGVATGEVVASRDPGRDDFIVTGDAVNVAARLQQSAEPWQILATTRTASADGAAHEFGPSLVVEAKGKAAGVRACPLLGRSKAARPRLPLVGREADLAQLELVARRVFTERRPYLVTLMAPAGTGKSRLVEEFLSRVHEFIPEAQLAIAQCLPYGQRLTYWPMRALLLGLIGVPEDAPADTTRRSIQRWLSSAGSDRADKKAELLAATIGASDAEVPDRGPLFAAWREAVERAASQRPLVLLVEDLHWSSDSLLDLIEFILQPRGDSPMLMLALTRPELLERRATWGGGRRNHVSLALEPLDDAAIGELVGGLLEGSAPELVRVVIRRSEGNPFFAGEIIRSLIERGVDLSDPAAVAAEAERLPDTVQATVLARLDSLAPGARRVLQLGSVLGRSFTESGLQALEPAGEDLQSRVEQLTERDLLLPGARDTFVFRHIIIRDVAYGTLTRSERAPLHAAAARWMEGGAAEREDELAELIAFHFREAAALGTSLDDRDEIRASAVRWLRRAADVAAGASGIVEAGAHLRAAIDLAQSDEQPALYQRLGEVYGSGDESLRAYERAWRLGAEQGLTPDFLLLNLGRQLMVTCRWFASVGQQPTEREIEALVGRGDAWLAQAGTRAKATFLVAQGFKPFWLRQSASRAVSGADVDMAHARVEEGLALAKAANDAALISAALDAMTGMDQSANWRTALDLSRERVALAHSLPLDERLDALQMVAWASTVLGELPEAFRSAEQAIGLVQPGQNSSFSLAGASWKAYVSALQGDWESTVATLEFLRQTWLEVGRPSAAYALQGLLSGVDWARNRGADELVDRWLPVADDIIRRFAGDHPVAALSSTLRLDREAIAEIVVRHERYPDRVHYVEHLLALCADRRWRLPAAALEEVLARAARIEARVVHAQALRLRGLLGDDSADLSASLSSFGQMGAERYAARVRIELATLTGDEDLLAAGRTRLSELGEMHLIAPGERAGAELPDGRRA